MQKFNPPKNFKNLISSIFWGVPFYPIILPNFKSLCCCNFMQKLRKTKCIDFFKKTLKIHVGLLSAQKLQNQIFPKKSHVSRF